MASRSRENPISQTPGGTNLHQAVMSRVQGEDIKALSAGLGDGWGAFEGSGMSEIQDPASHKFMTRNLRGNVRVKRLIAMGRADPDEVAAVLMKDFEAMVGDWRKIMDAAQEALDQGAIGFGMSTTGDVIGDLRLKAKSDAVHAIPAYAFILANLDRKEALPVLSRLTREIEVVRVLPDNAAPADRRRGRARIDTDTIFFAAALLLQRHPEESRYAPMQADLAKLTAGQAMSNTVEVTGWTAHWNGQEMLVKAGAFDLQAEPKMKLLMPDDTLLAKIPTDRKSKILIGIAVADGVYPAEMDPYKR